MRRNLNYRTMPRTPRVVLLLSAITFLLVTPTFGQGLNVAPVTDTNVYESAASELDAAYGRLTSESVNSCDSCCADAEASCCDGRLHRLFNDCCGNNHLDERTHKGFHRVLELPHPIESEKSKANFLNGVLILRMPKGETKPKSEILID